MAQGRRLTRRPEAAAVALVPGLALASCDTTGVQQHPLRDSPARTISLAVRRGSGHAPAITAVRDAIAAQLRRP
ncbi:hypothetical protein PWY87_17315 [Kribbella solani]|uniref:hypothetical protein n=1 Tax=Kribbella solani TaxID=236067 RepID=UPI0029A404B1|nr:hypothetical protein [Kribbella solani]MDX2968584.1 hypothetical protein [Kribbella solani]MDX3003450.1 hypothetical protein [Kribbella solani]